MTAQIPEGLINLCPALELGALELHAVIRGDPALNHGWGEPYVFQRPPRPGDGSAGLCSALWRGYVATLCVEADARVVLLSYDYPFREDIPPAQRMESVGEALVGDYWLVFKERFFGPRVYVPARDGHLVVDRTRWVHEPDRGPDLSGCPYDDRFEEALALIDRMSPAEQLKLLQKIGIVGPDGKLAPAYAPDGPPPAE